MILRIILIILPLFAALISTPSQTMQEPVFVNIISTTPHARLFVNDVERGMDSCIVKLKPGSHVFRAERKGWRNQVVEIVINDEKEQTVIIPSMEQLYATLEVDYEPYGSTVYINNEKKGVTPLVIKLPVEIYGLKIEMEQYKSYNAPVVLKYEDERKIITGSLQQSEPNSKQDKRKIKGKNISTVSSTGKETTSIPQNNNMVVVDGEIKRFRDSCLVKINKDWYLLSSYFTIPNNENELEHSLSKILFKSESLSLNDAYNKYADNFVEKSTIKDVDKTNGRFIKYQVDTLNYKPGKYVGLCAIITQQTVEKKYTQMNSVERHIIYDFIHKKVLKLDDIFIPEILDVIKQRLGNAKYHMYMTDNMIYFNLEQDSNPFIFNYNKFAFLLKDTFKQLVEKDWKKLDMESLEAAKTISNHRQIKGSNLSSTIVESDAEKDAKVFDVVEQMPSFPGGDAELQKFLSTHIKYPVVAEENGIQGRVIATVVVERDGSINDVKVIKSVDPSLDKEAIRVLKSMPRWNPGRQNGSAVRVKYTLPVTFRLQ